MHFKITLFKKVIVLSSLIFAVNAISQDNIKKQQAEIDEEQKKLIKIQIESIKQVTKSIHKIKTL